MLECTYVGPVIEHMLRTLPRYPLTLMSQHFITLCRHDKDNSLLQQKIMQGGVGRGGLEGKGKAKAYCVCMTKKNTNSTCTDDSV